MKKFLVLSTLFISLFSSAQIQCVDLSGYDDAYLNAVTSDNTTYPVGSAFITSGDIQYVKPSLGNFYQFIYGDSLMYIGDIDIDVSSSTCTNKTLTYKTLYNEGMMVDGDTIFYFSTIPTTYNGNGFTFAYDGINTFTVTGDFDVVSLFSSTNFLFGVCLDCTSSSINCVELTPYSEAYLNAVSWDDITYPVGSAFITDGYIQYVKPSTGNFYQFIQGDTLMYIGDIDIDVSTANCTNKILTFSSVYNLGMVIDGDTIFSMTPAPTFYAGNGFTFEFDGTSNFTITGDFDVVSILSSTNFLFDVCLECDGALGLTQVQQQSANEYKVFPNPTNGKFTLVSSSDTPVQCVLLNSNGQIIASILDAGNTTTFDLENYENGIYFLKIVESSGNVIVEKIIRN